MELANGLVHYYHTRGAYDSALVYYRRAIAAFGQAGLDSSRGAPPTAELRSTHQPWRGGRSLASSVANAGSALRQRGDLRQALRYYERARALYQQQHDLPGVIWAQSLLVSEQSSLAQALPTYEQALRAARAYYRQDPKNGAHILAGIALDYYAPLLPAAPGQQGYVSRLAAEATQALHAACAHGPDAAAAPGGGPVRVAGRRAASGAGGPSRTARGTAPAARCR